MGGQRTVVLVVGGTGYLGRHLLHDLAVNPCDYDVAFTYHTNCPPSPLLHGARPFYLDLQSGEGLDSISNSVGHPHVIINCAAISVPRTCETDPAVAMATNIPSSIIKWLSSFSGDKPLLIHLSTDQVYEGVKSYYREEDDVIPVNVYGKSKVEAEQYISSNCSNYAILRSSIIYGPQTDPPVTKSLPVQWIDSILSHGKEVEFFHDEYRCPVYVKDVVNVILALMERWISGADEMQLVLNVGGPDRLSRVQMAETVVSLRGYNTSLIKPVPAASVNRGVISPSDISMDISKLVEVLGMVPVTFNEGVKLTLELSGAECPGHNPF